MNLLHRSFKHRIAPAARPRLEELEGRDVPSYLAAEFPGYGVWRVHDGTWQQLTPSDATHVAADSTGDVVGEFPGHGIWLYRNSAWQQINTADCASLALGYSSELTHYDGTHISVYVAAQFPGGGLWLFSDFTIIGGVAGDRHSAAWMQLTPSNASAEAVDANGHVVAEFPGYGVWFNAGGAGGWQQLTPSDACSLAIGSTLYGYDWVVAAFPGYGVWRAVPGFQSWQQLTPSDATAVDINAGGDVTAAFAGSGIWSYLESGAATAAGWNAGWNQLTPADAYAVGIDNNGNVYGAFHGWGVWYDQVGSWRLLSPSDPTSGSVGG
jgi:hypothetical protein